MKRLAIASLVLNLLFAGLMIARWTRASPVVPSPGPAPSPAKVTAASDSVVTNVVTVVRTNPPPGENPEFHWSQLESTNYVAYRDNLRDFGCPEWLVKQIVFRDLVAQSRWDQAELGVVSREWKTSRQIRDEERAGARDKFESQMRVGQTMEELFGVFWLAQAEEQWMRNGPLMEIYAGFLPADQALEFLSRIFALETFKELMEKETGGILLAGDFQIMSEEFQQTMAGLRTRLGPAEMREIQARTGAVFGMFEEGSGLQPKYLAVTGPQFREISGLVYDFINPFWKEFVLVDNEDANLKRRRDELVALIEQRLGVDVAAKVLRAGEPVFRGTVDFTEKHELRPSVSEALYQTQQALKAELQHLTQQAEAGQPQPPGAREQLVETTVSELSKLLTAQQVEEYLSGPAGLLEFGTPKDEP